VTPLVGVGRILVLVTLLGAIGACAADAPASGSAPPGGTTPALVGTSWIVVSVNRRAPIPGAVPTVTFDGDRVSGSGGCNQFGGSYRADTSTGQLLVHDLVATSVGCLQAGVSGFEDVFIQALGGASQVALDPTGELVLSGPAGRIVLVTLEHPAVGGSVG
jgi:heat shock protein HslJ